MENEKNAKVRKPVSEETFKKDTSEFLMVLFKALGVQISESNKDKIKSVENEIIKFYKSLDCSLPKDKFIESIGEKMKGLEAAISSDVDAIVGKPEKPVKVDMEAILSQFRSAKEAMTKIKEMK